MRPARATWVLAALVVVSCARPRIGDIRPEAARYPVQIVVESGGTQLGGMIAAAVRSYRGAQVHHVQMDTSAAAVRIMLVVGLVPDPAAPGGFRLTGRVVDVITSVTDRGVTLTPAEGQTWRDLVPELVRELLQRPHSPAQPE